MEPTGAYQNGIHRELIGLSAPARRPETGYGFRTRSLLVGRATR